MAQRKTQWCWTLNNPTDDEEQRVADAFGTGGLVYHVFGRETGESGTPHLQGYSVFERAITFRTVKTRLGSDRLHIEAARGSPQQASDYCKKDGDFDEFGVLPTVNQGRRSDLERFYEWSDEFGQANGRPPTTPEAAREHPVIVTKYPRVLAVARLRFEAPAPEEPELRPWQLDLDNDLAGLPDDRAIKFVIDPDGGKGKSFFVKYFLKKHRDRAQFLSIGKRDDLAHVVKENTRVFLVDVPRGQMEYLRQEVLEQLKNGIVFSPKYDSRTKYLYHTPHVVVFANEHPEYSMTEDRYDVIEI